MDQHSIISCIQLPSGSTYSLVDKSGREMIAPALGAGTAYVVGDYFVYKGDLYVVETAWTSPNSLPNDLTSYIGANKPLSKTTIAAQIKSLKNSLTGALHFKGITTTKLTDGATTNPVIISGASYSAQIGDVVLYTPGTTPDTDSNGILDPFTSNKPHEFVWDGSAWQLLGSGESFKKLAFKDSASTSYTPEGTISGGSVELNTTTVKVLNTEGSVSEGTAPSFTQGTKASFTQGAKASFTQGSKASFTQGTKASWGATVANETLTISWTANGDDTFTPNGDDSFTPNGTDTFTANGDDTFNAGAHTTVTLPTFKSQSVATSVKTFTDPTFTGTATTITVS